MNTSRVIHKGHVGVCFGSLTLLTIIAMGLSLLGCQSDAQKMHNGKAREYQGRYSSCMESVVPFSRYAGFGFVEEIGVCQCNEKICRGNETCAPYGACNEPEIVTVKPECKDGEKICISSTMGQICSIIPQEDPKWGEPIVCTGGDVCNSQMMGEYICTRTCSVGLCREVNGIAYHQDCTDETYETEEPIKCGTNDGKVSCIDHTTCGECLNDTVRCEGGNGPEICINGRWTKINDDLEELAGIKKCILCEGDKCYNHQQCVEKIDKSGYEILLTTDKGKQRVKEECEYGCDGEKCANDAVKPACDETAKDIKCDINALETCNNGGWDVEICTNGCNPEKPACNPECERGAIECEGNVLKTCNLDGFWEELNCGDAGCNATSKKCETSKRCPEYCPDNTCDADGKCDLECSCGDNYQVNCKFGSTDKLVSMSDNVSNIRNCVKPDDSDYYLCGNIGEPVTSSQCCADGVNYCFGVKSYYCSDGKLIPNSNCGCDGNTGNKVSDCLEPPPGLDCDDDYYYICEVTPTSESVIKQCEKADQQNCTAYSGNDKKILSIRFDGNKYLLETCGDNAGSNIKCNGLINLHEEIQEMEETKCTPNLSLFNYGTETIDCDCSSAVGIKNGWYYMMLDENGNEYNSRTELYLSVGIDDSSNRCSVFIGPKPLQI